MKFPTGLRQNCGKLLKKSEKPMVDVFFEVLVFGGFPTGCGKLREKVVFYLFNTNRTNFQKNRGISREIS